MTKPTILAAALVGLATTATPPTADASPRRQVTSQARPLLRPAPAPSVPVAAPFTNDEGRPVCGNIANKGRPMRECVDAVGRNLDRKEASGWVTIERNCAFPSSQVRLVPASNQATVTRGRATFTTSITTSTDADVVACRKGLQ